jgi:hypothetical protein
MECGNLVNFGKEEVYLQNGMIIQETPSGILANNPLGYQLYNTYFKPVISKPSKETLREIFQDNDQGDSGYEPD